MCSCAPVIWLLPYWGSDLEINDLNVRGWPADQARSGLSRANEDGVSEYDLHSSILYSQSLKSFFYNER